MHQHFYRRRRHDGREDHSLLQQTEFETMFNSSRGNAHDIDEIPPAVRYQELRELIKLRYVMRRARKAKPATLWRKIQRWYIYPFLENFMTVLCVFLPEIYKERYRKLSYAVMEPDTWPHMFTETSARRRAANAWRSYANSLVDEWNSSNVIAALVLTAAGGFLAIPDINNFTRYSLMVTMLSSLASLAHATYHATYWRSILDDRHYSMLQLRCYISCYRPINRFLLCQPMLNLLYAMSSFSVGLLAYLWPSDDQSEPWAPNAAAKIAIAMIYGWQIGLIGASYKWNRSAFFTTNELLVGEDGRTAKVLEDEERRGQMMLREIEADMNLAQNIPIVGVKKVSDLHPFTPVYSTLHPVFNRTKSFPSSSRDKRRSSPNASQENFTESLMDPVQWVTGSMGHIPEGAIPLGFENPRDPAQLYVGRLFYKGRWRSGRVGYHIMSSFPYQGKEVINMIEYDVLCGDPRNFAWLEVPAGQMFDSAIPPFEGYEFLTSSNDPGKEGLNSAPVYIAGANYAGGRQLGEVLHGATVARIPYMRSEIDVTPFFVLLVKKGARVPDQSKIDTQ